MDYFTIYYWKCPDSQFTGSSAANRLLSEGALNFITSRSPIAPGEEPWDQG